MVINGGGTLFIRLKFLCHGINHVFVLKTHLKENSGEEMDSV